MFYTSIFSHSNKTGLVLRLGDRDTIIRHDPYPQGAQNLVREGKEGKVKFDSTNLLNVSQLSLERFLESLPFHCTLEGRVIL